MRWGWHADRPLHHSYEDPADARDHRVPMDRIKYSAGRMSLDESYTVQDQALNAALDALERSSDQSAYVQPFVQLFPVSGAAVSTIGELLGSETIAASD